MDDGRFDRLAKAVATGASRRSVLKGMLGLGGAALAGGVVLEPGANAARRPAPTPKPLKCPGRQIPSGGQCVCPGDAPFKCGPACCTGEHGDPPAPGHTECCDNACCHGTCYGEELCCPTNPGPGETPPLAEYCPGGGGSPDLCCQDGTRCCGAGTNENECVELANGGCCSAGDCGPPAEGTCGWDCSTGQCVSFVCVEGSICCQGACVSSSEYDACPSDPDECCDRETETCCGEACCAIGRCNAAQQCCSSSQFLCGVNCCENVPGGQCCGGNTCCVEGKCATNGTCCPGDDVACAADCCPPERCTAGVGCCREGFLACSGGVCCSAAVYQCSTTGPGCECLPGTEACGLLPGGCCTEGLCNQAIGECCDPGTTPCGEACCDDLTQTCGAQGVCECNIGLIPCAGTCIDAQCCGEDKNLCAELGLDLECVHCFQGQCANAGLDYNECDGNTGYCFNGVCNPCLGNGPLNQCSHDSQCCSNFCNQSTGSCQQQ